MVDIKLKKYARKLRNRSTFSEVLLWNQLKRRKMKGYRFLRQRPVDRYIVDFYCRELRLIIEIDGGSHYYNESYDERREEKLKELGFYVLRISDIRVKKDLQGVLWEIEEWIEGNER